MSFHSCHDEHHYIDPAANRKNRALLLLVVCFTFSYMLIEYFVGIWANSLALISDATHMLTDSSVLLVTLISFWLSKRPPTPTNTFGYQRLEVLVAFTNSLVLVAIAIWIFANALDRLGNPQEVKGFELFVVATIGLGINLLVGFLLWKGNTEKNMAVQSALLHVLGDALASVGAIAAGLLVWLKGFYRADPIISMVIAVIIAWTAFRLIRDSGHILLQGVPRDIDSESVRKGLLGLTDVERLHDLHIWRINTGQTVVSVHLMTSKENFEDVLIAAQKYLAREHGLEHVTIQVETAKSCLKHGV